MAPITVLSEKEKDKSGLERYFSSIYLASGGTANLGISDIGNYSDFLQDFRQLLL